jgi:hypothetical protein
LHGCEVLLCAGGFRLVAVMCDVQLCRFGRVVGSVVQVALSGVRVVAGSFVVARLMMPSGFAMVPSRVFVMLCCLVMMFGCLF